MAAQTTTTIETVTVIRPLKVISLVCLLISLILLIVCISTQFWLRTTDYSFRKGLFQECRSNAFGSTKAKEACSESSSAYVKVVAGLLIFAAVMTAIGAFANALGLKSNDLHRKYVFYKTATCLALLCVLCELVSLVVFPVMFFFEMGNYGVRSWEFDWSYGVAWGAMLFAFGASLMLICDKEHEEVYYKEKTIYNPPADLA
ncbi:Protein VAB-9 [Aphelenchoides avenae]|nr:Protein VAB-9 [Aphelenchus avenae]